MSGTAAYQNYLEMLLYHDVPVTGTIEVSLDSDTGPWTSVTLTTTKGVQDALTEWAALASAALSETFVFSWYDGDGIDIEFYGGVDFWVRFSPTLAELLGMSSEVMGPGTFHGLAPLALLTPSAIGRTQPRAVEAVDVEEHRMGRVSVHHHSRRRELTLELFVAANGRTDHAEEIAETLLESPIISGHAAAYVVMQSSDVDADTIEDYDEDNLGGRLLVFPVETVNVEAVEGSGSEVVVTLRCTIEGG